MSRTESIEVLTKAKMKDYPAFLFTWKPEPLLAILRDRVMNEFGRLSARQLREQAEKVRQRRVLH